MHSPKRQEERAIKAFSLPPEGEEKEPHFFFVRQTKNEVGK